jgi:hypothetical protein
MTPDQSALLSRYLEGPDLLERAIADLTEAELDAPPSAGGWTIRQIVHHVADGDDLWKVGIKAALGNEEGEFAFEWYRALSQDAWAERWGYSRRPVDASLALLRAIRAHVAEIVERVPGAWTRSIGVPTPKGTECISVREVIEMQTQHVEHHIDRIAAIRAELGED